MAKQRVTYVFHRPLYQDDDLDTLLVRFYFTRCCTVLIDLNKNNLTADTLFLILGTHH